MKICLILPHVKTPFKLYTVKDINSFKSNTEHATGCMSLHLYREKNPDKKEITWLLYCLLFHSVLTLLNNS